MTNEEKNELLRDYSYVLSLGCKHLDIDAFSELVLKQLEED